jgi:protein-disulfide isomerase
MMRGLGPSRRYQRFLNMMTFLRRGLVLAVAMVVLLATPDLRAEHDTATSTQKALEEAIREYLLSHPDVMLEVFDILREKQATAEADQANATIVSQRDELFNDPASPISGNPHGDVVIVEFFDYFCSYCKRVMDDVLTATAEDPGVRLVYKEFPILGDASVIAARAALAVHLIAPDKYAEVHEAMMSSRARLNEMRILSIAEEFGIDTDALQAAMKSAKIDAAIARNRALAEALGINGTPGFVIGDQIVPGAISLDSIRQFIAEARQS